MQQQWMIPKTSYEGFLNDCVEAVADPILFSVFRQLPYITEMIDNHDHENIVHIWDSLHYQFPQLMKNIKFLRGIDAVGMPLTHEVSNKKTVVDSNTQQTERIIVRCSTAILDSLYNAAVIEKCFGSLQNFTIIEIGGGYGLLCALLNHLHSNLTYIHYDLPEVCSLQKKYLINVNAPTQNIQFCTDPMVKNECDLLICASSLSELPISLRKTYGESVLRQAKRAWMQWNWTRGTSYNTSAAVDWVSTYAPTEVTMGDNLPYVHKDKHLQLAWGIQC